MKCGRNLFLFTMSFPSRFSHYGNAASHFKKRRGLHWKLRVDSSRREKYLLRGYFDFWITHGGTRCCVYLRLPEENILFSNRIFINILPLSVPCRHSKEWMHHAVHKCFLKKQSIQIFFTFRFAGVTPQPSHVFSKASWHCGFILFWNNFKATTFGRRDVKLLWNLTHVCGMLVLLCAILTFFPFTLLFTPLLQYPKTNSGIVGMQEDCFHAATIKPLRMEMEWKVFCFCFFWCDIVFLALGCTSGQTIIAFSSLGSSLFSIWSLPLSDFTIRGKGCSWGKEDNSWISHLIWAAREAWRTLRVNP